MTAAWDRVVATGSGALAFRLEIEGWPYQPVTDARLVATLSDGRLRVAGMQAQGITIGEDIDVVKATLDARGCTITIADVAGSPTYAFSKGPDFRSVLAADLTAAGTSVTLADTGGLANGDVIHIGTEAIKIGTVGTPCTGCTRGYWGSFGQAHYTADGEHLGYPSVSSRPYTARGRRARIYVYAPADGIGVNDNGTQIFLGRVSSDATISGASWQIKIDSIAAVLDQDLGHGADEAVPPRGIYYPWSSYLDLRLSLATDANNGSAVATGPVSVKLYGFYETQETFITALNAAIETAGAGPGGAWSTKITAESLGDGGWQLVARTAAASPKYPYMFVHSLVDAPEGPDVLFAVRDSDGVSVETVSAATSYYTTIAATVPRGTFLHRAGVIPSPAARALAETYPDNRIYVGGDVALDSSMTAVVVQWPGLDGPTTHTVLTRDTTARYISLDTGTRGGVAYSIERLVYGTDFDLPSITLARDYGRGTLYTLIAAITTAAPTVMNAGTGPDLRSTGVATTEDLDLATTAGTNIQAVVTEASLSGTDALTSTRRWRAYGPKKLAEVFAAEAQLLSCLWAIDSNGRLCLRRIPTPTSGRYSATSLGAADLDMTRGFGTWQRAAFGTLNTVLFKHGYDPIEDKYRQAVQVRDPSAFSIDKTTRAVKVEPVSTADTDLDVMIGTAAGAYTRIAYALLGIFGGPYATITVPVKLTAFNVLCGDIIELTHEQLPDPDTGTLGLTDRPCLVIGREFDMATGKGTLTLVTSLAKGAGYTPSLRISAATNTSGNTWELTWQTTDISGGSYIEGTAADWYTAGDAVRLWEWDTASPMSRWGTVDSVTATKITVTLTAAWGGFSGVYILDYARGRKIGDAGTIPGVSTAQQRYAYMADSGHFVYFITRTPAYQFSA